MRGCIGRVEKWRTLQELVGCVEPSLWTLNGCWHRDGRSRSWVDSGSGHVWWASRGEASRGFLSIRGKFWDDGVDSQFKSSFNSFAFDGMRSRSCCSGQPLKSDLRTCDTAKRKTERLSCEDEAKSLKETSRDGVGKWFARELVQLPNALSLGRMLSGPVIAHWIVSDQWLLAVSGLAVAGITDWLDGYVAKKQGQQSVIGSYLDPLADKVLIGCTVGALVYKGSIPLWVAGTVIARDLFLVVGTLIHHSRQSRGVGWDLLDYLRKSEGTKSGLVQPMFISKINTVVQLSLVAGCIGQGWLGWPGDAEVLVLSGLTVTSTLISWGAYVQGYFVGTRAIP